MPNSGRRSSKDRHFLGLVANNIRKAREMKGYSQEEFAHIAGFSRSYYTEIETGKRNISLLNLKKIMDALEMQANDVFDLSKPNDNTK